MIDVEADDVAIGVEVGNEAFDDLPRLRARFAFQLGFNAAPAPNKRKLVKVFKPDELGLVVLLEGSIIHRRKWGALRRPRFVVLRPKTMNDQSDHSWWPQELGMVATPLFGREKPDAGMSHLAMLDGVRASFLLSDTDEDISSAPDWAWSSNVNHHVLLKRDQVVISRTSGNQQTFQRRSVESKLDEFLRFLELDSDNQKTAGGVDHLIRLFRRHRATLREKWPKEPPDELESFLYLLALTQEEDITGQNQSGKVTKQYSLNFDPGQLTKDYIARFVEEVRINSAGHRLFTPMAVRHAGGALFQEAHAEILSEPVQMSLFGLADAGQQRLNLASLGVFYTPPGLARLLTEIALEPHLNEPGIRIHDPACGSGIFLCEALRALQRRKYSGRVILSGHDVSLPAIQMARFSIACALLDWKDHRVDWHIDLVDFFDTLTTNKRFNVILMNPPFRSWESLPKEQREFVRDVLEDKYAGRPDLSMAFVQESLTHLSPGGTLATLIPRGVLDSQRGDKWRQGILRRNDVRLIGTFADHGLFRHAMVSIAAMVLERKPANGSVTTMIWADEKPNSAEDALRSLRRIMHTKRVLDSKTHRWSIYSMRSRELTERRSWLPIPNALGDLVDVIKERNPRHVSELFTVRQGIKTGLREAFVLSDNEVKCLPEEEQQYFRRVASGNDIVGGRIFSSQYMFFAPRRFMTKAQLLRALPTFGERLVVYEDALKARKSKPRRWWEAARPRSDLAARTPRLLTKMFGGIDMAAVDAKGDFLPMQAFAWMPTSVATDKVDSELREAMLWWYCRILNSKVFFLLRREFAATITSGGQLDVSPRFINDVPMPMPTKEDLLDLSGVKEPDVSASRVNDQIVATAYGTKLDEWPTYEAN